MQFPIHDPVTSITWLYAVFGIATLVMCWGYVDLKRRAKQDPTYWKAKARFVLIPAIALMLCAGYWTWRDSHAVVEVTADKGIVIHAGLPGAPSVAAADIDRDGIKTVKLSGDEEYRPGARLFGTGAPGFMAGWFRLQGGEKAYMLVTTDEVVVVPAGDFLLVLSPKDPDGLVKALKE